MTSLRWLYRSGLLSTLICACATFILFVLLISLIGSHDSANDTSNEHIVQKILEHHPHVVDGRTYSLMIYIRSAVNEFEVRSLLRRTWIRDAHIKYPNIPIVFALAKSKDEEVNARVHIESTAHEDIIVFDFIDSYHNLSVKTYNVLRYHAEHTHSPHDTMLFWTNSDCFVDVKQLVAFIDREHIEQKRGIIYGQCSCSGECRGNNGYTPFRDPNDKWYMPWAVWPHAQFPQYCISYAVLMAPGTVNALVEQADTHPFKYLYDFWIDDALFTGVFAQEAMLSIQDRGALFQGIPDTMSRDSVATHLRTNNIGEMTELWRKWQKLKGIEEKEI